VRKCQPKTAYSTTGGLAVTLTFDLLTSKFNQFIFFSSCYCCQFGENPRTNN